MRRGSCEVREPSGPAGDFGLRTGRKWASLIMGGPPLGGQRGQAPQATETQGEERRDFGEKMGPVPLSQGTRTYSSVFLERGN